jgi:murein L,D-transpeptidase YcbB/YkuD
MADPNQILADRNAEVAKIRGYVDLTDEAKERKIAEVTERANAEYAAAKEAEKAQIHAAYRQGSGNVYWATMEPGEALAELEKILKQAERTDDTLMAKVTYHRAIDLGLQPIIDRYLADRPKEEQAMECYAAAVAR